jgi:endoglucanase
VTSRGSRIGVGLAIVALSLPIAALGVAYAAVITAPVGTTTEAAPAPAGTDAEAEPENENNPLKSQTFYADPQSLAAKAAAQAEAAESPSAAILQKLAAQPAGIWLTPEKYPTATVGDTVTGILDAADAEGATPVFVVYGVPNRDCGNFSTGGLTASEYPLWVSAIAGSFVGRSAVVILEPDALALSSQCGNTEERIAQIKGAVDTFSDTDAVVYLDGGHSTWLPATEMAQLLNRAGISEVRGFATNVSNYNSTVKERAYGEKLSSLTGGSYYVVDTGRNGAGSNGEWCNPTGRALGAVPTVSAVGHLDAQLWIKPPGESDGTCGGGPAAGEWWLERALEQAGNAGW